MRDVTFLIASLLVTEVPWATLVTPQGAAQLNRIEAEARVVPPVNPPRCSMSPCGRHLPRQPLPALPCRRL